MKAWTSRRMARRYLPGNRLNLWRGLGVTPRKGEYPLIESHLHHILANDDPLAAR